MHCVRQLRKNAIRSTHDSGGEANSLAKVRMKNVTIFFLPILLLAIVALVFRLGQPGQDFGFVQLCLASVAALAVAWLLAMLFNFAIFGPLYWWLGRLQAKKNKKETAALTDRNPGT